MVTMMTALVCVNRINLHNKKCRHFLVRSGDNLIREAAICEGVNYDPLPK